jgi:lysozyme family protein
MKDNFEKALAFTLPHEGVYSNDPADPGGQTKYGISRRYHPEISAEAWASFSLDDAKAVYRHGYWDVLHCDDLPFPLDCICFDSAVNPGTGAAERFLAVTADPQHYIITRMQHYLKHAEPQYKAGLIQRCIDLISKFIEEVKVI